LILDHEPSLDISDQTEALNWF